MQRLTVKTQAAEISIHALLAESDDLHRGEMVLTARISIHALLAESDRATSFAVSVAENFYPRSPCGERPEADGIVDVIGEFLSTLSLRRATWPGLLARPFFIISIHALLAESDIMFVNLRVVDGSFLSTLSLRRATGCFGRLAGDSPYFYPRSPCGERPMQIVIVVVCALFLSTLSLRRATRPVTMHTWKKVFLSTLSLRRATRGAANCYLDKLISIHALLAESDTLQTVLLVSIKYFYPRSPCGERPGRVNSMLTLIQFLSTLSLRRATCLYRLPLIALPISIHALLAESDGQYTR